MSLGQSTFLQRRTSNRLEKKQSEANKWFWILYMLSLLFSYKRKDKIICLSLMKSHRKRRKRSRI